MREVWQFLKEYLQQRRLAYLRTFPENSREANLVLKDLARFCRAGQSTFHQDPRLHAVLEGRREVWLRIQKHLKLDEAEFLRQYGKVIENE